MTRPSSRVDSSFRRRVPLDVVEKAKGNRIAFHFPALESDREHGVARGGGGFGGPQSANNVTIPQINIHGVNDPEQIANQVHQRMHESMSQRTHDIDHGYS